MCISNINNIIILPSAYYCWLLLKRITFLELLEVRPVPKSKLLGTVKAAVFTGLPVTQLTMTNHSRHKY